MPVAKKIRIGTRASKLALTQANEVKDLLLKNSQISEIEIVTFTTSGDKILDKNLAQIGGKGLFIKELEEALLENKIDIAVHSAKDVPPFCPQGLILAAFTARKNAFDAFVSAQYSSIKDLPQGAKIGTSSARRKAFLLKIRPDLEVVNFRGNIDSRLKKVAEKQVDGAILAVAGLQRAGLEEQIKEIIASDKMLPSGGQGCLTLEMRENDKEIYDLVRTVNDAESEIAVVCERAFLQELGASCVTPVGVFAEIFGKKLHLRAVIIDFEGEEIFQTESFADEIALNSAINLGKDLAQKVKKSANELLSKII